MNNKGLVSIVLVNYMGEKDTIECIKSINDKLTYEDYIIIVVDNSPTNDSIDKIKEVGFLKCIFIKEKENKGFASACNVGIRKSEELSSKYVLLLNNDTIIKSSDLIEQLMAGFEQEKVGMVGGNILYNDNPDESWYAAGYISKIRLRARNRLGINKICETSFITGCMQMISMDAIRTIGYMSEDYFLCYEDTDYCERMHIANYKTIYNPKAEIFHKVSKSAPASSAVSVYNSNKSRYIYIQKYHRKNILIKIVYFLELLVKMVLYKGERQKAIKNVFEYIFGK